MIAAGDIERLPEALAPLPPDLFVSLYIDPPEGYPALKAWLPAMPSADVQRFWTGNDGYHVMLQAQTFVDELFSGMGNVADRRVLDYGAGWGRFLRLLYSRVRVSNLFAVDPSPDALGLLDGLHGWIARIDRQPERLPFDGTFDVIFAYSVFTHIGPTSQRAVLNAMRAQIAPDGVLGITIRHRGFWPEAPARSAERRAQLTELHEREGFAYGQHPDKSLDYGDVSMSTAYIEREWKGWRIDRVRWKAADPNQLYVFLRPR